MSVLRGYWVRDLLPLTDRVTPRCTSRYTSRVAIATFAAGKTFHCDRPAGKHRLHQSQAGVQWQNSDREAVS